MRGQNTSQDCFVANTLVNPPHCTPLFQIPAISLHLPKLSQIGGNARFLRDSQNTFQLCFSTPIHPPPRGRTGRLRAPLLPVLRAPVNMVTMDVTT